MNLHASCGGDFTSVRLFDAHRVGKHGYLYAEGLKREPPRADGRRCLRAAEMLEQGWQQDTEGRWLDPAHVERAREAFATAA